MRTDGGCLLLLAFLSQKMQQFLTSHALVYNHTCVGKEQHDIFIELTSSFELNITYNNNKMICDITNQ